MAFQGNEMRERLGRDWLIVRGYGRCYHHSAAVASYRMSLRSLSPSCLCLCGAMAVVCMYEERLCMRCMYGQGAAKYGWVPVSLTRTSHGSDGDFSSASALPLESSCERREEEQEKESKGASSAGEEVRRETTVP